MALEVLGEIQVDEVRMSVEVDPEHLVRLSLRPQCPAIDGRDGRAAGMLSHQRHVHVDVDHVLGRVDVDQHFEAFLALPLRPVDAGKEREETTGDVGRVPQGGHDLDEVGRLDRQIDLSEVQPELGHYSSDGLLDALQSLLGSDLLRHRQARSLLPGRAEGYGGSSCRARSTSRARLRWRSSAGAG